jgi:hypothetical protein
MISNNLLLAVTGCVGSGKSYFCTFLRADAEVILHVPIIYLPFDLWINKETREAEKYANRFFLSDLIEAVRCIKAGNQFLIPRYDIMKTIGKLENTSKPMGQELIWNNKAFLPYRGEQNIKQLSGAMDFYVDSTTGCLYSLFPTTIGCCYLMDGTLVAPQEVRYLYDLRIYVDAPWAVRVARMIRRFNRREVFGATQKSMGDYVGFLVKEARECADEEIRLQIDDEIMRVESIPDTISNYLDLAYLRWLTELPETPDWVDSEQVEEAMREYLDHLKVVHDAETISRFRRELIVLMESKHLLALPGVDQHLVQLNAILH